MTPEDAAQDWHHNNMHQDDHPAHPVCWCCCELCDPECATDGGNPHWDDAEIEHPAGKPQK